MNKLLFALFMVIGLVANAQDTLSTKNAVINFDATSPSSPEKIEAVSKLGISKMLVKTGEVAFALQMMSFEFEKALMKDHFNENYMETSKFPRATFKGNIQDFSKVNFSKNGKYPVKVKGSMTLHGVTKEVIADGFINVTGDKINATSTFKLILSDFNIKVPDLVKDKVAREATITVNATYNKM